MNEYQALMTQRELCNRWQVSEATLEYEASCLRKSNSEAV